jgi:hypothetical protein
VLRLLAPDVLIFEGGDMETRDEYRGHHLGADIEFLRAVRSTHSLRRVDTRGDAAWVGSTSKVRGTFRGRALDLAGAELVVLRRSGGDWTIAAVHWSSRERTKR